MIPYARHDITENDIEAVKEVLGSNFLTQGPVTPRFEQEISNYCKAAYTVLTNSSTSSLHIACIALDLGPGDWLWTSPNTFVASANCGLYCGANISFVDIDPLTYNMCIDKLAIKLEQAEKSGQLPKIVIPVHFAGQPCDMPAIYKLSKRYGFKIIEDASHAIGASYTTGNYKDAKTSSEIFKVGCCAHSDITVFSFHPIKIITSGEGGAAVTNSKELASRMSRLRTHGITSDKALFQSRPENEIWNYQQIELGFNYRMNEIQAALGLSQISRLDSNVNRRHKIAKRYDIQLANFLMITPWQDLKNYSSYHLYPIRINANINKKNQRQIYDLLWQNGIAANLHYIPVHRQPYYEKLGFKEGDFPEAEKFHREVISLPIFPTLDEKEQEHVIEILKKELLIK
jgi:dTDP-4-amino-4,6-dideoxygalactose transaminase